MPNKIIYEVEKSRGADFAFDAVGNLINWAPVVRAARLKRQRLTIVLSMLFTEFDEDEDEDEDEEKENVQYRAKAAVIIPLKSRQPEIMSRVYSAIRDYIAKVAKRLGLQPGETPSKTVALLSSVVMVEA